MFKPQQSFNKLENKYELNSYKSFETKSKLERIFYIDFTSEFDFKRLLTCKVFKTRKLINNNGVLYGK